KAIPGVWVFSCQIRRRSGSRQRAPLPVRMRSSADAELLDQGPVAGDVFVAQVLEQALTLADLQQQTTAAVVVVLVHLEVLGEVIDVVRQQRDLDLGRAGVGLAAGVLGDDLLLRGSVDRHSNSFIKVGARRTRADPPGHSRSAAVLTALVRIPAAAQLDVIEPVQPPSARRVAATSSRMRATSSSADSNRSCPRIRR